MKPSKWFILAWHYRTFTFIQVFPADELYRWIVSLPMFYLQLTKFYFTQLVLWILAGGLNSYYPFLFSLYSRTIKIAFNSVDTLEFYTYHRFHKIFKTVKEHSERQKVPGTVRLLQSKCKAGEKCRHFMNFRRRKLK